MSDTNRLVLVDTNCLIRVYFSPLRPIFDNPVAGFELKTLEGLAKELKLKAEGNEFAWLGEKAILDDVDTAIVQLTREQRRVITLDAGGIVKAGNAALYAYFNEKQLKVRRTLSFPDAQVLAACLELNAILATDEWPLRHVAKFYDYDDGEPVELFSSVELIELFEREKLITRDERIKTYSDWLKDGTAMLRESTEIYFRLFKEAPPSAQG